MVAGHKQYLFGAKITGIKSVADLNGLGVSALSLLANASG